MKPVANKNRCRTNMTSRWMQDLRSAWNTQDTRFGFVSRFPDRLPEIVPLRAAGGRTRAVRLQRRMITVLTET
jgi:hypothetical protein